MKNHSPTQTITRPSSFEGFAALDQIYNRGIPSHDIARYGRYGIAKAIILDTPADVTRRGYVLTNPSQIETFTTEVTHGQLVPQSFAYFRHEPASLHLGKTESLPYFIRKGRNGKPYLAEFPDATVLPGEDPRMTRGVRMRGLAGTIHNGWLVSTTIATPKPEDPAYVKSIKQVFYWGENLGNMEVVAQLDDTKNTTLYPVAADYGDWGDTTALDTFARLEKPHTTYLRLPDITDLTRERIESAGVIITDKILTEDVNGGPNFAKGRGPNHRELDSHESHNKRLPDGRLELHYRLVQYDYELPSDDLPKGRLIPLGVIATRSQFPGAPAKTPENGVASYEDVLYGSAGYVSRKVAVGNVAGQMLVGASDSQVGLADVMRFG